jgi:hypothetical protein
MLKAPMQLKKGFISSEIKYLFPSFPTLIALSFALAVNYKKSEKFLRTIKLGKIFFM